MKYYTEKMKIEQVIRLNNSYYGNPRFEIIATQKEIGNILVARTASNAMIGYEISPYSEGHTYIIKYHITKNNNIILDRVIREEK